MLTGMLIGMLIGIKDPPKKKARFFTAKQVGYDNIWLNSALLSDLGEVPTHI